MTESVERRCQDYDGDYVECWQCGGEGYIANCWEEFACIDPEGGCDACLEPCDICQGKGRWLTRMVSKE